MGKKNRIGLQFDGWKEYVARLDKLAGSSGMKQVVEGALVESKKHVNAKIEKALDKSNLPAQGKYSHGRTLRTLDKDMSVEWDGDTAEIKIGWRLSEVGLTSVFLMYGTPRHGPVAENNGKGHPGTNEVKGLKAAIYGNATRKEVAQIQEEAVKNALENLS